MGVLQTDLTGGEPLARTDLAEIIRGARAAGLYASLITSGMPLDERRLEELVGAGLDHLQLSFQGARGRQLDRIRRRAARDLRTKAPRRELGEEASHRVHAEFRDPPGKSRPAGSDDRAGRGDRAGAGRVRARAVLRLGVFESRPAAALARATRSLARNSEMRARAAARAHPRGVRCARLLREVSEAVHGRLGAQGDSRDARRRRPALPRRAGDSGADVRERPEPARCARFGRNLRRFASIAAKTGCSSLAKAAIAAPSISADAGARHICLRAARRSPILYAPCLRDDPLVDSIVTAANQQPAADLLRRPAAPAPPGMDVPREPGLRRAFSRPKGRQRTFGRAHPHA